MKSVLLPWTLLLAGISSAQNITVHVINDEDQKPLKGIAINLRNDCWNPKRPRARQKTTDANGIAIFQAVSLGSEPTCIDLFSVRYRYAPRTLDYVFISPGQASQLQKSMNPVVTGLPANITFHVNKRPFSEQLQFLFLGP